MTRQAWRYTAFSRNLKEIIRFCERHNFKFHALNNGYQVRIENVVDVYPVRRKYHILRTLERGTWNKIEDLTGLIHREIKHGTREFDIAGGQEYRIMGNKITGVNKVIEYSVGFNKDFPDNVSHMKVKKILETDRRKKKWWQVWRRK